jgi:hypothetical protein
VCVVFCLLAERIGQTSEVAGDQADSGRPRSARRSCEPSVGARIACSHAPAQTATLPGAWYRARGWWGGRAPNQDSYQRPDTGRSVRN